jgi:hypothetical protein
MADMLGSHMGPNIEAIWQVMHAAAPETTTPKVGEGEYPPHQKFYLDILRRGAAEPTHGVDAARWAAARIDHLEAKLAAAERERDSLRAALQISEHDEGVQLVITLRNGDSAWMGCYEADSIAANVLLSLRRALAAPTPAKEGT